MTHKATIGSISHGTLRNADLLVALSDELDRFKTDHDLVAEARAVLTLMNAGWTRLDDLSETGELVLALAEELDTHAPPYCYFGAHEGDASDYGFWPSLEAIEELPKVSDPSEVDDMDEDCVFVNDHGNVTVYAADGSVIWDCV